eukprot:scaffold2820_cov160-Amphora_coffeaeformis.AAC.13
MKQRGVVLRRNVKHPHDAFLDGEHDRPEMEPWGCCWCEWGLVGEGGHPGHSYFGNFVLDGGIRYD